MTSNETAGPAAIGPGHNLEDLMTDNTATATVATITAEVRQLIVGSRQVTASVYNQLDRVPPEQIEPMGRVTPKDGLHNYVYVVGKHTVTGDLVAASCPTAKNDIQSAAYVACEIGRLKVRLESTQEKADDLLRSAKEAERNAADRLADDSDGYYSVAYWERVTAEAEAEASVAPTELKRLEFLAKAADARYKAADRRADGEKHNATAEARRQKAQEFLDEAAETGRALEKANAAYSADVRARMELAERWAALPLIVLAGLR